MKFAKVFEQTLKDEGLPEEWLNTAIQYKLLKKCINRVVSELERLGLQKQTLSVLFEGDGEGLDMFSAKYSFEKDLVNEMNPRLIIEVKKKEIAQDNTSTSDIVLQNINSLMEQFAHSEGDSVMNTPRMVEVIEGDELDPDVTRLVINMSLDSVFFHTLFSELKALDNLKLEQERKMIVDLENVGSVVSSYSTPSKRKSDIYVWREIFKEYIDSEIFFSTSEFRPGERNVDESRAKLTLFLKRITERNVVKQFHHKKSAEAFYAFYKINIELLKASQFQTYNKLAVTKILKKFDKQTSLRAKSKFPKLMENDPFINMSFAHTICAIISNRLLNIVPQLDDYTCPICCSVLFKPIRLDCGHVFCVRCLVKMQRKRQDHCPMCRADVVMKADETNLDMARLEYLKMYFPRETKEKQLETEREIAKEQYELVYGPEKNCCIQ